MRSVSSFSRRQWSSLARQLAALVVATPLALASTTGFAKVTPEHPPGTHIDAEGELEVQIEDYPNNTHRTRHFLKTAAGKRHELKFKGEAPQLISGTQVRVSGTVDENYMLALAPSSTTSTSSLTVTAPAVANTFGDQHFLVMLVNFQDQPTNKPWTAADAQSLMFTNVNGFYQQNSFQQASLSGDVAGWFTLPINSTDVCDEARIATAANNAATAAGYNLAAYGRLVYAFPQISCGYAGLATVGGNPSRAYINGSLTFRTVGHELGHNFGLDHSHAYDCDTSPTGSNCTINEYGDRVDIMGGATGHLTAFQKERLGWLNYGTSPAITTVQTTGSYVIEPYSAATTGVKALKIPKGIDPATGAQTWYYVEYRQPIGFDSFITTDYYLNHPNTSNLLNGVLVHTGTDGNLSSSYMLDMTPGSLSWYSSADLDDPALAVGVAYTDSVAGVTIKPTWSNSTGIGVDVTFGSAPATCTRAAPTVTLSPGLGPTVSPGTAVSFTVAVTNNDSGACGSSSFNLQSSLPSGWGGTLAATSLSVGAGSSASTTLNVTSAATSVAGSYSVGATATNATVASATATGWATYSVAAAGTLSNTATTDKASYLKGDTVTMRAKATVSGAPLVNATVTFVITKPNGSVMTQSAVTGSTGVAVYKWRTSKQKDPSGNYQMRASVTSNGQSSSALANFAVN